MDANIERYSSTLNTKFSINTIRIMVSNPLKWLTLLVGLKKRISSFEDCEIPLYKCLLTRIGSWLNFLTSKYLDDHTCMTHSYAYGQLACNFIFFFFYSCLLYSYVYNGRWWWMVIRIWHPHTHIGSWHAIFSFVFFWSCILARISLLSFFLCLFVPVNKWKDTPST